MHHHLSIGDPSWLDLVGEYLRDSGYVVIDDVLDAETLAAAETAVRRSRDGLVTELGEERWRQSLAMGHEELRLPMRYDSFFYRILENETMLAVVDRVLSPRAVLRFQQGLMSPVDGERRELKQHRFHMNFRSAFRAPAALDFVFAVTEFNHRTGSLEMVPGSHMRDAPPADAYLAHACEEIWMPPGALLVMDSTLWHREQPNYSEQLRLGIDHQVVMPFIKPHIDYVRALGAGQVTGLPERVQQLLGWYNRVPANLDEFYVPPEERVYRSEWQ